MLCHLVGVAGEKGLCRSLKDTMGSAWLAAWTEARAVTGTTGATKAAIVATMVNVRQKVVRRGEVATIDTVLTMGL